MRNEVSLIWWPEVAVWETHSKRNPSFSERPLRTSKQSVRGGGPQDTLHKHGCTKEKPCFVNAATIQFRVRWILNFCPPKRVLWIWKWVILISLLPPLPLLLCHRVPFTPQLTQTACPEPALSHCLCDRHGSCNRMHQQTFRHVVS